MKKLVSMLVLLHAVVLAHSIEIRGNVVPKAYTMSSKALSALKQHTIGDMAMVCKSGNVKDASSSYEGVLLKDVIDTIKTKSSDPKMHNSLAVSVIGDDGYEAVFSYHELFNTLNGNGVLLSKTKNGKTYKDGWYYLVSANDIKTGPRHVWEVKAIVLTHLDYATHKRKAK